MVKNGNTPDIPNARKARQQMLLEIIERLMIRKISRAEDIQKHLAAMDPPFHLTTRTIYSYKGLIIKKNTRLLTTKEGLGKTVEEMALELKITNEEILRELWNQYHSQTAEPADRIRALAEIRKTTEAQKEMLQSLGLLYEAPIKHQVLDKDGKPVDPPKNNLVVDFIAFMKAKYQEPVGSEKQTRVAKAKEIMETVKNLPLVSPIKNFTPLANGHKP